MKFVNKAKYAIAFSALILIVGIVFGIVHGGLNWGLDFTGGTILTIDMGQEYNEADVRDAFAQQGITQIQLTKSSENGSAHLAVVRVAEVSDTIQEDIVAQLKASYPDVAMEQMEKVGPAMGQELTQSAIISLVIACVLMLVYIWIRFELASGVTAVLALLHDVLIMVAFVTIFRIPINSTFVAAVLTIVGYSINNTIIIFDRIRENRRGMGSKDSFGSMVDLSLKQSLTRTLNTSITTLVTITALYILGVESIKEFSLPIIVGLIAGTYSSLFIAPSVWSMYQDRKKARRASRSGSAGKKQKKKAKA